MRGGVGIEKNPEYLAIAEARVAWAEAQPRQLSLFDAPAVEEAR